VRALLRHPARAALAGAIAIAFSAILYRTADVSPETGAFFRCAYALPALWLVVRAEERLLGPRPRALRLPAYVAGAFFAADLLLWHHAIEAVGAGLATVLGNTQVVLVGLIAWALFRERPAAAALAAIPIAMVGIVLISGVLEEGAYGENPPLGVLFGLLTGIAYSGFLLTLRHGSADLRRPAGPLFDATLASTVGIGVAGALLGDLDLLPGLEAQGWLVLLALSSQVVGWLLIAASLPRLPAAVSSVLLTFQPLCSVGFAALILGEKPSGYQLLGAAAILAGLILATSRRERQEPEPAPATAAAPP
jgi:drug/metabolite transporter (DMT)-like permease